MVALALTGCASSGMCSLPSVGTSTRGGAIPGGHIYHVTTLADDGPGSLREGVRGRNGTVIVFDVSGVIRLASDLKLHNAHITIAGQTAPDPGISIKGSVRIRTHDVIIEHLAVRPGPAASVKEAANRDAISMDGKPGNDGKPVTYDVLLLNISASWSTDELISMWYPTTSRISIVDCFINQALADAQHPKGAHSMGVLIGTGVKGVELSGNLIAANRFRNPVISQGASVSLVNNWVFDGGQNFVHTYPRGGSERTLIQLIGNVFQAGLDTKQTITAIYIAKMATNEANPDLVYLSENQFKLGPEAKTVAIAEGVSEGKAPILRLASPPIPVREVPQAVLRYAGARPANRDAVDRTALEQINAGTIRIISMPPALTATGINRVWKGPAAPFEAEPDGRLAIVRALCRDHLALGGKVDKECR